MKTRWIVTALATLGVALLITAYLVRFAPQTTPITAPAPTGTHATPPAGPVTTRPTPDQGPLWTPAPQVSPIPTSATGTDTTDNAQSSASPVMASDVLALAGEFAARFARPLPGVTREQWWADVAELMTAQARADYADIDPAAIPYTAVTGPASILSTGADHSDLVTFVQVPTTAGIYVVHLRIDPTRGWAVNQVTPPNPARS